MRIINFQEFCNLPDNTIFSYFNGSDRFSGLWQRGEVIYDDANQPIDYFQFSFLPYKLWDETLEVGVKERWGEFDFDQLYAVYENDDILSLINMVDAAPEVNP